MGGPLTSAQRHGGELGREPALSGRPANPPPPNGESEKEGGDAEGDAPPALAPQGNVIPTSRTRQDTDLSWDAGAPDVRVFATCGLQYRKAPDVAGV